MISIVWLRALKDCQLVQLMRSLATSVDQANDPENYLGVADEMELIAKVWRERAAIWQAHRDHELENVHLANQ